MAGAWRELTVHTSQEAVEAVSHWLLEQGAPGVRVEEQGGAARVSACFRTLEAEQLEALRGFLARLPEWGLAAGEGRVETRTVAEEDWAHAWKRFYHVQRIGPFAIVPSWERYVAEPGVHRIELDPGMAFGTGTHPTTRLCLKAVAAGVAPGRRVWDIGTGSGILAIAAAKLGAAVVAVDVDTDAIAIARANVRLNGVEGAVRLASGSVATAVELAGGTPPDFIVCNIVADVILALLPDLCAALGDESGLLLSGLVADRLDEVERALAAVGGRTVATESDGEWRALLCRRR
ncbi:MAG TPA: 50S ribosomal protein L11 methyltransferase [Limnochordia bacterium]|nr:50S ribosomal protein L11 methyltransferase [Limnochordia bacterium]